MKTDSAHTSTVEGKTFGFPRARKLQFFVRYVWTKTVSFWYEVKAPRFRLFIYEVIYSICRAVGYPPPRLAWLKLDRVETTFGVFNIRPGTTDAACVSPGFERPDLNELITLLSRRLTAGRTVLFLDVGADVGTYAISVGNRLRSFGEISVLAFEPASSSYELLRENVVANGLTEVVDACPLGLGDGSIDSAILQFNPREPGGRSLNASLVWQSELSEKVEISTIDKQVNIETLANVVALKLDVEGSEISVLNGAAATLAAAEEVLLVVEDFLDESVITYLQANGWSFQEKLTPYNSFWSYSRRTRT
jgi:FkbM family methyltransferase